ncbi:HIT family protein [sulfur-oxidizing endosymbiont of Gigantopelta aegis]|uniref:HIT family protein n=1 Tax=sulfur-oxidizing endosymbiont of Gigantopelta aegis TaxID=2794934 RepID=UPI0018DAFA8A|nr:HIT family protein [sulfur-oxidizing endosymbiont of Gigantopelta aegis]
MAKKFTLDSRLANDCFILSESDDFLLLLMNNALVPWFILVPKVDKTELYELESSVSENIALISNKLSQLLKTDFKVDKINIAAIGNIVSQLHIHIIGRYENDAFWPGVVWGAEPKESYEESEVTKIKLQLKYILLS